MLNIAHNRTVKQVQWHPVISVQELCYIKYIKVNLSQLSFLFATQAFAGLMSHLFLAQKYNFNLILEVYQAIFNLLSQPKPNFGNSFFHINNPKELARLGFRMKGEIIYTPKPSYKTLPLVPAGGLCGLLRPFLFSSPPLFLSLS